LTIQEIFDHPGGRSLLQNLDGGVVGGAPISGPLAKQLSDTSLRVGYGLTEAAPGVALGPPGKWAPHYLGRPVGCSVEIADDGELLFQGPNARVGIWRDGGLDRADPDRPVPTGDLVERRGDDLFFRGRKDDALKLSNGRLVQAGALEAEIKTRFSELRDAFVFTPNGSDVAVAVCPNDPETEPPSSESVREVLGSLGNRLVWTTSVEPEAWTTRSKGSVDRHVMADTLTTQYESTAR
jgi:long-subunit acyl-CoA synthetase (AMP-forming)